MPSEEILSAATAIARAAKYALRSAPDIPEGLTVEVADGHVTLRGEVAWEYEREAAERAVRAAAGVRDHQPDQAPCPLRQSHHCRPTTGCAPARTAGWRARTSSSSASATS